jgi:hypothetical protein
MSSSVEPINSNIKQVKVTGAAAESLSPASYDIQGGGKKSKTRKGQKKIVITTKDGGGSTSPGTMVQLASTHVSGGTSSADAAGKSSDFTDAGAAVGRTAPAASADPAPPPVPVAKGGAHDAQRVVLTKSRKKSKVVLGAPAKSKATPTAAPKKHKTAKKVHVSLSGLGKKL